MITGRTSTHEFLLIWWLFQQQEVNCLLFAIMSWYFEWHLTCGIFCSSSLYSDFFQSHSLRWKINYSTICLSIEGNMQAAVLLNYWWNDHFTSCEGRMWSNILPRRCADTTVMWCVLSYLPRGNSPSSLRQRTVGVGSPCTSQKKSTVSSAITTWLTGCLVNTGLSGVWQRRRIAFCAIS